MAPICQDMPYINIIFKIMDLELTVKILDIYWLDSTFNIFGKTLLLRVNSKLHCNKMKLFLSVLLIISEFS